MKFKKILISILLSSVFTSVAYADQISEKTQSQNNSNDIESLLSNGSSTSNSDNYSDEETRVKNLISEKYAILKKFSPNFKVNYIKDADLFEVILDNSDKAYTNSTVSYLFLKGQVFINQNGKLFNITNPPKTNNNSAINSTKNTSINSDQPDIKKSSSTSEYLENQGEGVPNQQKHNTLFSDNYLNSFGKSSDIDELKYSAMLQYVGTDGGSSIPKNSVDYVQNLDLSNAAKIVYGNGKRTIIMFADPDCPYCQNMEHTLTVNADKVDMTLYILPWALDIHPKSQEKIDFLWSQKDPSVAWQSWMSFAYFHQDLVENDTAWSEWIKETGRVKGEKSTAPMNQTIDFVKKYGLNSTPTIVYPNGSSSVGDLDFKTIMQYLSIYNRK